MNTSSKNAFNSELTRQFGKKDASMFMLAPHKYEHHFDRKTLAAYNAFKRSNLLGMGELLNEQFELEQSRTDDNDTGMIWLTEVIITCTKTYRNK